MSLTLHKKEVLSIAFDQKCLYCVTSAKDSTLIIYHIDSYFKQARQMHTKTITTLPELSHLQLQLVHYHPVHKCEVLYVCIADNKSLEVYKALIQNKDISSLDLVVKIDDAQ